MVRVRVIVAEDKPLILRSIKEKIQNFSPEIEIVGEATDGESALSLINCLKPDIVFTDIRMPVMDGLKLIAKVRETGSNLHFVIISGYDEFEYARQAMKLNVSDYLLKPVKQEEVNEVLKKIFDIIAQQKLESARNLIQSLLNSNSATEDSFKDNLNYDYYITMVLNAGPYTNFVIDYANPFNSYWSSKDLKDIISRSMGYKDSFWVFEGKSFNEQIIVFGISKDSTFSIREFPDILKHYLDEYNIPVTIAVSQKLDSIKGIGIETQIVRALLRQNLVFGKQKVFFRESLDINSGSSAAMLDSSLEKRLAAYIQSNQKTLFHKEIDKVFKYWEENSCTQNHIEKSLKYIIKLCGKADLKPSNHASDLELETDEVLSSSKDYTTLVQGMRFIFEQFFISQDRSSGNDISKDIVNKVENYLNVCFSDPVTINDIAKMVKLHPAYLSRIFKNMKGISPMEYLTTLRIKKAKELILSDANLSLKDIAEIIGYTDQFYFSRIFKTITGKSPSDYKNSNRG